MDHLFMYLEDGMIKNKVVFYNFGLGKNDPKRVVGVFMPQDLSDAMAGRVRFMDDSHAVIFTDKGLQFFSTRIETSPESTAQILLDENIRSISYTDQYAAVVTDNSEGSEPYRLHVYRADGSQVFEIAFSFQYSGFDIDEDLVLLYNDNSCLVYNMAGTEKFKGSFDFPVSKVSKYAGYSFSHGASEDAGDQAAVTAAKIRQKGRRYYGDEMHRCRRRRNQRKGGNL